MRTLVGLLLAFSTLLACGCNRSRTSSSSGKSPFYTSCSDLKALVTRAASDNNCRMEEVGDGWGRDDATHYVRGADFTLVPGGGQPVAKVLQSLKTEVGDFASQTGAEILHTEESPNGNSLEMTYGIGNARGKIDAKLKPAQPESSGRTKYQLRIHVEEMPLS